MITAIRKDPMFARAAGEDTINSFLGGRGCGGVLMSWNARLKSARIGILDNIMKADNRPLCNVLCV